MLPLLQQRWISHSLLHRSPSCSLTSEVREKPHTAFEVTARHKPQVSLTRSAKRDALSGIILQWLKLKQFGYNIFNRVKQFSYKWWNKISEVTKLCGCNMIKNTTQDQWEKISNINICTVSVHKSFLERWGVDIITKDLSWKVVQVFEHTHFHVLCRVQIIIHSSVSESQTS